MGYRDADKEAYARMTPEQEYYEENKPITRAEYVVRKRKFDALISITGKVKNRTVLSLGCGGGMDCEWLSLEGAKTTGIDVSSRLIKLAKRRLKKKKLKGNLVVGDMQTLPFKKESFDLIVSYDALHHSDNITESLLEANRTTKNLIGVVEPNDNCLSRKVANIFFKGFLTEHSGLPAKAYSVVYYLQEFKKAGFKIKKHIFCNIVPPEVCVPNFKISYGFLSSLMSLLSPIFDALFERLFPFSCSACIMVGNK